MELPPAYDVATRQVAPVELSGPKLEEAIKAGTHSFQTGTRVPVIAPDGSAGTVPAEELQAALTEGGFKLDTPEAEDTRKYLEENKGVVGSLKVAGGGLANEALLGVPEAIYENTADEKDVKQWEALKEDHPVANVVGKVAGVAASTVVGGEVFNAAAKAGKATEGLVAGTRALEGAGLDAVATDLAPSLARQAVAKVAGRAVEGAVVSAPRATAEAFTGDPERAAETLFWGAGIGGLIGGLESGVGTVARKAAPSLESGLGVLEDNAEKAGSVAGLATKGAVKGVVGGVAHHALPGSGLLIAGMEHNVSDKAGEFVKDAVKSWLEGGGVKVARSYLKELAQSPLSTGLGTAMATQGESVLGQHLARLPSILSELGSEWKAPKKGDERGPSREEFQRLSDGVQRLATDTSTALDLTSGLAQLVDHDQVTEQVALQLQAKALNAVNYLNSNLPKNPFPVIPFAKNTWKPSAQDERGWLDRYEVVQDPMVVLRRLQQGSLNGNHVDALKNVYPKIYEALQKATMETASDPDAPHLSYIARARLSVLMGLPLDPTLTSASVASLQSSFGAPSSGDSGGGAGGPPSKGSNIKGLPTQSTTVQRVANGRPGKLK